MTTALLFAVAYFAVGFVVSVVIRLSRGDDSVPWMLLWPILIPVALLVAAENAAQYVANRIRRTLLPTEDTTDGR